MAMAGKFAGSRFAIDRRIFPRSRLLSIGDQVSVDRIKELIAALRAQKAALHPEQKQ